MHPRHRQAGYSLIEIVAFLGLTALATGLGALALNNSLATIEQSSVAREFRIIEGAAQAFMRDNYQELLEQVSATGSVSIDVERDADLDPYLPPGAVTRNTYNQTYAVSVWQDTPQAPLRYMVFTRGGDGLQPDKAARTASLLGSEAGYIPADGQAPRIGSATGTGTTDIPNTVLASATLNEGHIAALGTLDVENESDDYLYRQAVPGRPELNEMNTDLGFGLSEAGSRRFGIANADRIESEDVQARNRLQASNVYVQSWVSVVSDPAGVSRAMQRPDSHIQDEGDCANWDGTRVDPCDPASPRLSPFNAGAGNPGTLRTGRIEPGAGNNSGSVVDAIYFDDDVDQGVASFDELLQQLRQCANDPGLSQADREQCATAAEAQLDGVLDDGTVVDELIDRGLLAGRRGRGEDRQATDQKRLDVDLLELVQSLHRCGGPDGEAQDRMTLRRVERMNETGDIVDAIVLDCVEEVATGAVAHFEQDSCPARWYPLVDAQGRMLRGVGGANGIDGAPALAGELGGQRQVTLREDQLPRVLIQGGSDASARRGHSGCRTCHTRTGRSAPIDLLPPVVSLLHCVKGIPNDGSGGQIAGGGDGQPPVFENEGVAGVPEPEELGKPIIGQEYREVIVAFDPDGGALNYELVSGVLPPGLSLSGNLISGTPQAASRDQTFQFRIRVTDRQGLSSTRTFAINFRPNQAPIWQTATEIAVGTLNAPYFGELLIASDPDPLSGDNETTVSYREVSRNLPAGMDLRITENEYGAEAPELTGTPRQEGNFSVTLRAQDRLGASATRRFVFSVGRPAFWAFDTNCCGRVFLRDGAEAAPYPDCRAQPTIGERCASPQVPAVQCIDQSNPAEEVRVSNGSTWPSRRKVCLEEEQLAGTGDDDDD